MGTDICHNISYISANLRNKLSTQTINKKKRFVDHRKLLIRRGCNSR